MSHELRITGSSGWHFVIPCDLEEAADALAAAVEELGFDENTGGLTFIHPNDADALVLALAEYRKIRAVRPPEARSAEKGQ